MTSDKEPRRNAVYRTTDFAHTYGLSVQEAESILHRYGASKAELDLFMAARRRLPVNPEWAIQQKATSPVVRSSRSIGSIRNALGRRLRPAET